MKNKKFTIGLTLLMATGLFLVNCTKGKKSEAPSPDYEFASTQDVNRIQMVISDIEEMGGIAADQYTSMLPWGSYTPLSIMMGTNTINSNAAAILADNTPGVGGYTVTFNNTIGKDGHVRNGQLRYNYGATTTVAAVDYYRQPGYTAVVTGIGYTIDDYSVAITGMTVTNTTPLDFPGPLPAHTPTNTNMTWRMDCNVSITNTLNAETTSFTGTIYKTLLNTRLGTIFPVPTSSMVNTYTVYPTPYGSSLNHNKVWYSYSGTGSGVLPNVGAYNLTMTSLTRNMNTTPETFVAIGGMFVTPERHPFLTGMMTFKPGNKPTRDVDYGVGDNVDYNAKVTIEGITYDVDCK